MKENIEAAKALFFFKPYTVMDRWLEIAMGIMAWINLGVVIVFIIKVILKIIQIF